MAYTALAEDMMPELYDSPEVLENKVNQLALWVKLSSHMVCFTGAGISTSCGIPDFRGPQGKWTREAKGLKPLEAKVPTVKAFPSTTHMSLVKLQEEGILKYLISQNCDGLHRRSGIPASAISELHGNSNIEVCEDCGQNYLRDTSCHRYDRHRDHFTGSFCSRPDCNGGLLEYTIDFGQNLPVAPLAKAEEHANQADLHVVFGSSLTVSPACDLPAATAQRRGSRLVICNLQRTPLDEMASLCIRAKTDTIMAMLMAKLQIDIPVFALPRRIIASVETQPTRHVAIRSVDVHDPSLELSLIRRVEWLRDETDLSQVPVLLHWTGHYKEPPLRLDLDLRTSPILDVCFSYDPYTHEWTIKNTQCLQHFPQCSSLVLSQQNDGKSYSRAHRDYCVQGVEKANPSASKMKCVDYVKDTQGQVRAWYRKRNQNRLNSRVAREARETRAGAKHPHTENKTKIPQASSASASSEPKQAVTNFLTALKGELRNENKNIASLKPTVVRITQQNHEVYYECKGKYYLDEACTKPKAATVSSPILKVPLDRRPGEFKKIASEADMVDMKLHVKQCQNDSCSHYWSGPWGPFIGGAEGRNKFDLTTCRQGRALNRRIGWNEKDPRS